MGRDESGTLARLREHRQQRLEPTLARHGGRLVKSTGDGALVEFPSAVDALGAAIEFQQAMAEANTGQPEDRRIVFRIGLHLGDLIVDGDDLYGDGVNVAARLEVQAPAGGIVISRTVHEAVSGRLKAGFDDLGSLALKNIERPVQAFAVKWRPADWLLEPTSAVTAGPSQSSPAPDAPLPLPKKPSIAVLPFQNMSGDPEQEYFSDGLTENITTDLSRFGSLFVIGRNTAFTYKGKAIDLKQIGRELGVHYALEGSVQRGADRVRVNVQLIDTQSGGHLWAERFDRSRSDLFSVQDEISRRVAYSLSLQVNKAELERGASGQFGNPESTDLILRAMATGGSTQDTQRQRQKLYERSAEVDPQNADAWAGLARTLATRVFLGWSSHPADDMRSAKAASERALAIAPDYHFAVFAKGHVAFAARDFAAALEAYEYAMELNPSHPVYHHLAGMAKTALGRPEEAIELHNEAIRLSPRDLYVADFLACLGSANWEMKRYLEAIPWLERAKAQNPRLVFADAFLASSFVRTGQQEKAEAAVNDALLTQPAWTTKIVEASYPFRPTSLASLVADLRKAGLKDE